MPRSPAALFVALVFCAASAAVVGGPLTPPAGPVESTLKTLDEVEPSTPIESLPSSATGRHVISKPGAYHLTGNLTVEDDDEVLIELAINPQTLLSDRGVTIDLRGHTLDGGFMTDHVIEARGRAQGLVVSNGRVENTSQAAIEAPDSSNVVVEQISLSAAGSAAGAPAIALGAGATVRDIQASSSGPITLGDASVVERVVALGMRTVIVTGSSSRVADVTFTGLGGPPTFDAIINAGSGSIIERVTAQDAIIPGIIAGEGSTVRDSTFINGDISNYGNETAVTLGGKSLVENVAVRNWGRRAILVEEQSEVRSCRVVHDAKGLDVIPSSLGVLAGGSSIIENCHAEGFFQGMVSGGGRISACTVNVPEDAFSGLEASGGIIENNLISSRLTIAGRALIDVGAGGTARGNRVRSIVSTQSIGIRASGGSDVRDNALDRAPIRVIGRESVIDSNTVTGTINGPAIVVTAQDCLVIRNRIGVSTGGYSVVSSSELATVRTSIVGAGPWDNFEY